jgi:hypothetical protein
MSISALTSEAARLLAYFQSAESDINAAVAAAIAAIPNKQRITYYVDSIAGDDGNAGTIAEPLETLNGAFGKITGRASVVADIRLAPDGAYVFGANSTLHQSLVSVISSSSYDPRETGGKPVVTLGYYTSGSVLRCYAIGGRFNALRFFGCNVHAPQIAPADLSTNRDILWGPLSSFYHTIHFEDATVTLHNAPMVDGRQWMHNFYKVVFARGNGTAKYCADLGIHSGCLLNASLLTLPAEETLADIFGFHATEPTTGQPRGVCSNLDLDFA